MNFLSHGNKSNLLEHIKEVCLAAENLEERIICACHDIGKATSAWQQYAKNEFKGNSPHPHAVTGGLLASLIIKLLNRNDAKIWSIVALHAAGGHHSHIGILECHKGALNNIVNDVQAKHFFINEISSLLPEVDGEILTQAWIQLKAMSPMLRSSFITYNDYIRSCSENDKMKIFIFSRSLLGRLCYQDYQSASKQSGNSIKVINWRDAYPEKNFTIRQPKNFIINDNPLNPLRNKIKEQFHQALDNESIFYFIDAPTGLGKTETMLSGAEKLIKRFGGQHIIFSVPQISIADQIYSDYFSQQDQAQIWHYIRQEKTCSNDNYSECANDNYNAMIALNIALQPFSESYNITTFNQILLAMCHPLRTRCIKSIGLKNAIIIMDEFHKLPLTILPYFFRIAEEYGKQYNCRFILGSATPLGKYPYLGIENAIGVDQQLSESIYSHILVNNRRRYKKVGILSIDEVAEKIDDYHENNDDNLLVVLNLVAKGTWALFKKFGYSYNPWQQLEELQNNNKLRVIVFLDGLVPPVLRREIIFACKKAMCFRPVTLITTQMIEVGVDLDFDHGIIDYQGIAATIQRGGRVGREGRGNRELCNIDLFSLDCGDAKDSFQILCDVQLKNDIRMKNQSFENATKLTNKFWKKEKRFFSELEQNKYFFDSDLVNQLQTIQNKVLGNQQEKNIIDSFFVPAAIQNFVGIGYLIAQYIAELFGDNFGTELLILKDNEEFETVTSMMNKLMRNEMSLDEKKKLNQFIIEHKITISSPSIIVDMGLVDLGHIVCPDFIRCMQVSAAII